MKRFQTLLILLLFGVLGASAQTTGWSNTPTITTQSRMYNGAYQVRFLSSAKVFSLADSLSNYATAAELSDYLPLTGGIVRGVLNLTDSGDPQTSQITGSHIYFTSTTTPSTYTQYALGQIYYNVGGSGSTAIQFITPTSGNTLFVPNKNGIFATTGDNISEFTNDAGYVTAGSSPDFTNGITTNGITIPQFGSTAMTLSGNSITGTSNGVSSEMRLSFGVYLLPGYEGVYANDYTNNTELFHFCVPEEADEQSRIDENFQLNFTVPSFNDQFLDGQIIVKDLTQGILMQLPLSDIGLNLASNDYTSQTAANSSVVIYTLGSSSGITHENVFNVQGYINVASITSDVIEMQVNYTDENNVNQTIYLYNSGATSPSISAVGNTQFPPIQIRAKYSTSITVSTVLTTSSGSINYDCGANIQLVR